MIVWVLVSLLLFFVVRQWAMIKPCNNCTALQSRAGRIVFKLYYSLLTSVFYFLKNYFHVAKVAIIHRKYVEKVATISREV
jgi:hypothetical protein